VATGIGKQRVVNSIITPIAKERKRMTKGMERKKEDKKKPAKTMKEKRAAKKAKREAAGSLR